MAYSKKVVEKFENTLNEPEKNSVGRWDPSDLDIGTGDMYKDGVDLDTIEWAEG